MTLDVKNRKIFDDGVVELSEEGAVEAILSAGINANTKLVGEWQETFLKQLNRFDHQLPEFNSDHDKRINEWLMPKEYLEFDIQKWLFEQCKTEEETERVQMELALFGERNMLDLLRYIKYLVDTMRENNIVWGVGRGSSVSSYSLYLLGLHKINSLRYKLDIREFLK